MLVIFFIYQSKNIRWTLRTPIYIYKEIYRQRIIRQRASSKAYRFYVEKKKTIRGTEYLWNKLDGFLKIAMCWFSTSFMTRCLHFVFNANLVLTVISRYFFRKTIPRILNHVTTRMATPVTIIGIERMLTRLPTLEEPSVTVMEFRTSLTWSVFDPSVSTKAPTIINPSPIP